MKTAVHPTYHTEAKVSCACGNTFAVGSTKEEIRIELCSQCHPFYTGKQKFVDTARRVEKFQEKLDRTKAAAESRKGKKAKRAARAKKKSDDDTDDAKPKTPKTKKEEEVETPAAPVAETKPEETTEVPPAPATEVKPDAAQDKTADDAQ